MANPRTTELLEKFVDVQENSLIIASGVRELMEYKKFVIDTAKVKAGDRVSLSKKYTFTLYNANESLLRPQGRSSPAPHGVVREVKLSRGQLVVSVILDATNHAILSFPIKYINKVVPTKKAKKNNAK